MKEAVINNYLKKSKKIEITDLKKLKSEKNYSLEIGCNAAYGIAYQLKKFSGINENVPLNCTLEHGAYFVKFVCHYEVTHPVSHIITVSPFREEVIRELTDIIPIAIGPYIAYAEEYRSETYVKDEKAKKGRVLLVMPSHSTKAGIGDYNIEKFIHIIEKNRKEFDTVMVCLHWEDMNKGLWKPYKKMGYTLVSAGSVISPYFLSRLKYIFNLSDAVIFNAVTTGMAYAMYMNKPFKLIRQDISYSTISTNNSLELEVEDFGETLMEVFSYSDNEFSITQEQRKLGNYLFGLEKIKSKKEMKRLLTPLLRVSGWE